MSTPIKILFYEGLSLPESFGKKKYDIVVHTDPSDDLPSMEVSVKNQDTITRMYDEFYNELADSDTGSSFYTFLTKESLRDLFGKLFDNIEYTDSEMAPQFINGGRTVTTTDTVGNQTHPN